MIFHGIYVTVIVLLLFGVSIFAHELGHFIAARAFGMVVEVFSLGFGPSIWKKKYRGTLYKIGIFPIGGYVALPQMDPTDALPTVKPKQTDVTESVAAPQGGASLPAIPSPKPPPPVAPWKKIVVAAAGAAGNMVLAAIIAWIVYWGGKPSTPGERSAIIGFVDTNSVAYTSGLRIGHEVLAVNDVPVATWNDVIQENARFETVRFVVRTPQGTNMITVPTEKNALGFRMVDGLREITLCKVMAVEAESSAAQAGVQPEDIIVRFNDVAVFSVEHLVALVSARPDTLTPLAVERGGEILALTVSPQLDPVLGRARIGIRFDPMAVDYDQVVHIPPSVQLKGHATMILRVVRALVSKEARHTAEGLGGPPMILYMIQDAVRKGIMIALWFMCFLNVNLAILNLMPIPVLDGGHIMFSLWELVTRRPIHPKLIAWIYQFFFFLFIAAIILLSGRDFQRLYKLRQLSKTVARQMADTNALAVPEAVTNEPAAP
ncbi:MAG: site-2 protease family protein [Verrucomicrobia bacterium]|nr:site-2 protease family protein [Verrucomicrobiota bacterium]MBU1735804.1 site-2 protease family protein [Verrucomicrobiota bacterium]MBU1858103.1 site-2 protease family protein [Verrucomicrobiota bacterium]